MKICCTWSCLGTWRKVFCAGCFSTNKGNDRPKERARSTVKISTKITASLSNLQSTQGRRIGWPWLYISTFPFPKELRSTVTKGRTTAKTPTEITAKSKKQRSTVKQAKNDRSYRFCIFGKEARSTVRPWKTTVKRGPKFTAWSQKPWSITRVP